MEPQTPQETTSTRAPRYTGLSGNEMYCIDLLGYEPGNLLVGNSVFSMGFIGGIGSNLRTIVGGEITQITNMIAEGRRLSLKRFDDELAKENGAGATGVTSELIFHSGNVEFLTVGSTIHHKDGASMASFNTAADGQELFCQWDAGYQPVNFVFGNVAYSIGIGRGIAGAFRQLAKGEVQQYSDIFNKTRNLALERIAGEAREHGANSVIGIKTTILPVGASAVQEMVMVGTAARHEGLDALSQSVGGVITSDLTAEETWNIAKLGYAPVKLVLGTSVYSLGFVGGIMSALKNFVKGEIPELTQLIYGAREESLRKIQAQAEEVGADDVLGIQTYIYNLGGGLIEFLAIGTAVKKVAAASTHSEQLPPQAIIRDKDTFFDAANAAYGTDLTSLKR